MPCLLHDVTPPPQYGGAPTLPKRSFHRCNQKISCRTVRQNNTVPKDRRYTTPQKTAICKRCKPIKQARNKISTITRKGKYPHKTEEQVSGRRKKGLLQTSDKRCSKSRNKERKGDKFHLVLSERGRRLLRRGRDRDEPPTSAWPDEEAPPSAGAVSSSASACP